MHHLVTENRICVYISMLQNYALSDICLLHCVIYEMDLTVLFNTNHGNVYFNIHFHCNQRDYSACPHFGIFHNSIQVVVQNGDN